MLTRDDQCLARTANALAADALLYDTFPDCHIAGGSSWARGWPEGHRTDWDRNGFRIETYPGPTVVASVTWAAIRRHGRQLPADLMGQLRANRREAARAALHAFHRPGYSARMCPAERWMLDAWRRGHWERLDRIGGELARLLDLAFPLATGAPEAPEPTDLLELLETM